MTNWSYFWMCCDLLDPKWYLVIANLPLSQTATQLALVLPSCRSSMLQHDL